MSNLNGKRIAALSVIILGIIILMLFNPSNKRVDAIRPQEEDIAIVSIITNLINNLPQEEEETEVLEEEIYIEEEVIEEPVTEEETIYYEYTGEVLNAYNGKVPTVDGRGMESYYNLDMSLVVENMNANGYSGSYWVRDDGVKMFGDYVMVAANLNIYPRGSIVNTTLGQGIVCDTGSFAESNPYDFDIAVSW